MGREIYVLKTKGRVGEGEKWAHGVYKKEGRGKTTTR